MYLGQSGRPYSDVCSFGFGNAGWHHAIHRFTGRHIMISAHNLWLVGGGDTGEFMGLRVVRRFGNSADPFRHQRVLANVCCPLRLDANAMQESILACVRLQIHVRFSCIGVGAVAPRIPSPATSRGLSDTLGNFQQAFVAKGKPVIEARLASDNAIFSNSMSDQALSVAAKKSIHFLLGLGVAAATFSIVAGTCRLEVVGAIVP